MISTIVFLFPKDPDMCTACKLGNYKGRQKNNEVHWKGGKKDSSRLSQDFVLMLMCWWLCPGGILQFRKLKANRNVYSCMGWCLILVFNKPVIDSYIGYILWKWIKFVSCNQSAVWFFPKEDRSFGSPCEPGSYVSFVNILLPIYQQRRVGKEPTQE